jgi:Ser/Thr protein kinase RdoA (MazF antagonist)
MHRGGPKFLSEELACVLSRYDIGIIQQAKPLGTAGSQAAKLIIVSDRGKFVLKRRARGKDDPERVAFAHSVQMQLARMSFPVARLVPSRSGETMVRLGDDVHELFEYVSGSRYDGSAKTTTDAGKQLAKFHRCLADFSVYCKPVRASFHDSATVRRHLQTLGAEPKSAEPSQSMHSLSEALTAIYNTAGERVNALGFQTWPDCVVHGDWHPGNMLFCGGRIVAVLDFDSVKLAPAVTDVANAMLQFSIVGGRPNPAEWPDYLDQAKLVQILAGYLQISVLGDRQIDSLLDLMVETMIAEAVLPVAATGFFGHLSGLDFLKMIRRKGDWINNNRDILFEAIYHSRAVEPG